MRRSGLAVSYAWAVCEIQAAAFKIGRLSNNLGGVLSQSSFSNLNYSHLCQMQIKTQTYIMEKVIRTQGDYKERNYNASTK